MGISGVYTIDCLPSGKKYVGSSKDLQGRKTEHLRQLKRNTHGNRYLQFAWNKYGEDKFVFRTLLICSKEELLFYEQMFIDLFMACGKGFNLRPKAENNLGIKFSKKICKKFSDVQKGKKLSLKTRKKLSDSHKGQIAWNKGKLFSTKTRKKMGDAHKGKSIPLSVRKKISDTEKGKFISERTRELISKAGKGRQSWNKGLKMGEHTDGWKKQASISQKRRWSKVTKEQKLSRRIKILAATTHEQRSEFVKRGWETRRRNALCQF